jgi:hypothetical protein
MVDIDRSVRGRAFLDKWFAVAVTALLVLALVLGWWAFQVNLVPETRQEERLVEDWSESTSYAHSALVVNDSLPFADGTVVRNRPLYYFNLSKQLDGTYTYAYDADSGDVRVTTETFLLVRGGELVDQRVNQTFWRVSRPLSSTTTDSLGPGDRHTVEFAVDIRSVLETIATVERQVGATEGAVDVRVRSVSTVTGEIQGDRRNETYESDMVMVVNPSTFRVARQAVVDERHREFETRDVLVQPPPARAYGSIALSGLAAVLLLSLAVARLGGYVELAEDERELLRIERHREQYSEWITTGTFPAERNYDQTVLVDDLEGLIDVAIDTNKRVIEDPQLGVSTVLDDNYIYIYVRPDSPARDWLVNYADTTLDQFEEYEF